MEDTKSKRLDDVQVAQAICSINYQDVSSASIQDRQTDNDKESEFTYTPEQSIVLNQYPVSQNNQVVYQLDGTNFVNLPDGSSQQNIVYIVVPIPSQNDNQNFEDLIEQQVKENNFESNIVHKVNRNHKSNCERIIKSEIDDANNLVLIEDTNQLETEIKAEYANVYGNMNDSYQENEILCETGNILASEKHNRRKKGLSLSTIHQYKCDFPNCYITFPTLYKKSIHIDGHYAQENTKYKCSICNMEFNKAVERNKHVESHTVVDTYQCVQCSKSFPYYTSLIKHTEEEACSITTKLYECKQCSRRFATYHTCHKHCFGDNRNRADKKSVCKGKTRKMNVCTCSTEVFADVIVHKSFCGTQKSYNELKKFLNDDVNDIIVLD